MELLESVGVKQFKVASGEVTNLPLGLLADWVSRSFFPVG